MPDSPAARLREAAAHRTVQVPGAPNALVGKLIERWGYEAAYLSGAALSAGALGLPDVGLLTLTELVQHTAYLTAAVEIPVLVDADTGFGGPSQVERTVRELERAGAAAIQLEDQTFPKRCGHLAGKSLISPAEMCDKLRAAANARRDEATILIARTDAAGVEGLDAAIARGVRYLEAGADWVFPEALENRAQFARYAREVQAPLVANMTEFGQSPLLSHAELTDLGYAAVLYPVTLMRVMLKAAEAALGVLLEDGSQQTLLDLMQTRAELYELLDYRERTDRDPVPPTEG